jgi:hypothetical protein
VTRKKEGETESAAATRADEAPASFAIKDCALLVLATGRKARFLQEFRNHLADVVSASIYHHFWGGLLQPRFEEREYNNDFASWVRHGLHDGVLAERLAALDPTQFSDLEALRTEVIELVDTRLDEREYLAWSPATDPFEFACAQIVVFDTHKRLEHPRELAASVAGLSTSSVFYHFIDARTRTPDGRDDFSEWLGGLGGEYNTVRQALAGIDPYFSSLGDLRERVSSALAPLGGMRA